MLNCPRQWPTGRDHSQGEPTGSLARKRPLVWFKMMATLQPACPSLLSCWPDKRLIVVDGAHVIHCMIIRVMSDRHWIHSLCPALLNWLFLSVKMMATDWISISMHSMMTHVRCHGNGSSFFNLVRLSSCPGQVQLTSSWPGPWRVARNSQSLLMEVWASLFQFYVPSFWLSVSLIRRPWPRQLLSPTHPNPWPPPFGGLHGWENLTG